LTIFTIGKWSGVFPLLKGSVEAKKVSGAGESLIATGTAVMFILNTESRGIVPRISRKIG
jgi:hypothetical protein